MGLRRGMPRWWLNGPRGSPASLPDNWHWPPSEPGRWPRTSGPVESRQFALRGSSVGCSSWPFRVETLTGRTVRSPGRALLEIAKRGNRQAGMLSGVPASGWASLRFRPRPPFLQPICWQQSRRPVTARHTRSVQGGLRTGVARGHCGQDSRIGPASGWKRGHFVTCIMAVSAGRVSLFTVFLGLCYTPSRG